MSIDSEVIHDDFSPYSDDPVTLEEINGLLDEIITDRKERSRLDFIGTFGNPARKHYPKKR